MPLLASIRARLSWSLMSFGENGSLLSLQARFVFRPWSVSSSVTGSVMTANTGGEVHRSYGVDGPSRTGLARQTVTRGERRSRSNTMSPTTRIALLNSGAYRLVRNGVVCHTGSIARQRERALWPDQNSNPAGGLVPWLRKLCLREDWQVRVSIFGAGRCAAPVSFPHSPHCSFVMGRTFMDRTFMGRTFADCSTPLGTALPDRPATLRQADTVQTP